MLTRDSLDIQGLTGYSGTHLMFREGQGYRRAGSCGRFWIQVFVYFTVFSNDIDTHDDDDDDDVHVTVLSQSCLLLCIPVRRQTVLKISTKKCK